MPDKTIVRVVRCTGDMLDTHVLIQHYPEPNRSVIQQIPLTEKVKKRMDGRQHQFFFAALDGEGGWKLGAYAPYQDWGPPNSLNTQG